MGLPSEILRRGDRRTKGASEDKNKDKQRRSSVAKISGTVQAKGRNRVEYYLVFL